MGHYRNDRNGISGWFTEGPLHRLAPEVLSNEKFPIAMKRFFLALGASSSLRTGGPKQ